MDRMTHSKNNVKQLLLLKAKLLRQLRPISEVDGFKCQWIVLAEGVIVWLIYWRIKWRKRRT